MSLKAKLEAVIYAAEEPVTLAQLSAIFAADALEWKAQQAASADQDADAAAEAEPNSLLMLNQAVDSLELDPDSAVSNIVEPAPPEAATESASAADPETPEDADPDAGEASAVELAADEKRLARLRDREVRAILKQLLDELMASYVSDDHGVEIREIAGGYRMATKPEYHDAVRFFVRSLKPALKLSLPSLETLAVIAYKQPVTAPEVNEIRGVDSSGVFGSLLARKLIATSGRKQVIGRPILYKTTREFLLRFGLKDVSELPSMEEFEKMAAIELDEEQLSPDAERPEQSDLESTVELVETVETDGEELAEEPAQSAVQETPAEPTPTEAAPAAPQPTEQAETE